MTDDKKTSTPMDPTAPERPEGAPSTNNQRVCGAIKALVAEFHALFPETPVEYSTYDGRNTALAVAFDVSMLSTDEQITLVHLFEAVEVDPRIESVDMAEDQVFVLMRGSLRTQDLRDSFGLADAYSVLVEDDEDFQ